MKTVKLCAKNTRYFNNRWYRNYYATIPRSFIEKLSLEPGDSLSVEQEDQSIVLTKAHSMPVVPSQISKNTFKQLVFRELANGPKTWSELRLRTHLHFKRPPPQWIHELRVEYGLEIIYDATRRCMLGKIMDHTQPTELVVQTVSTRDGRSKSQEDRFGS